MKEAQKFLQAAYAEKIAINPKYSLRAFARDLSLSPQQLSNFLNGRRGMSGKASEVVARRLGLSHKELQVFLETVRADFSRSKIQRSVSQAKLAYLKKDQGLSKNLELDLFKVVSNWYHFALLELIKISKNNSKTNKTAWFANKLGIPENEVKMALNRLQKLDLITLTTHGWQVNQVSVTSDRGIPTEAVRKFHEQVLQKAIQALHFQNQDERYGSSTTLPVRIKSVQRAKALIQKFREEFNQEIADQESADEVFALSIQFFRHINSKKRTYVDRVLFNFQLTHLETGRKVNIFDVKMNEIKFVPGEYPRRIDLKHIKIQEAQLQVHPANQDVLRRAENANTINEYRKIMKEYQPALDSVSPAVNRRAALEHFLGLFPTCGEMYGQP